MNPPEFPKDFYKHCLKVREAKYWHKALNKKFEDEESYAECAFIPAGCGMKCENCNLFLTRPYLNNKTDEEFLPKIEEFYQKLDEYEKWCEEQKAIEMEFGAGI